MGVHKYTAVGEWNVTNKEPAPLIKIGIVDHKRPKVHIGAAVQGHSVLYRSGGGYVKKSSGSSQDSEQPHSKTLK